MDRFKELEIITRCLELTRGGEPPMTDEETRIPVAEYCDEGVFTQERESIFRKALNLVAHSSQLPSPGDFITRDVAGTPVVLVRHTDGGVKAFLNVCRHRGATVELRAQGQCRRFVCPYHGWSYKTDGSLASVRHQGGFPSLDLQHTSLVELRCLEASGLIWVCPDPTVEKVAPTPSTLALFEELEGLGCAEGAVFDSETRVWNANWKLIVDGGLESYHFRVAHRNTIGPFFADNLHCFDMLGDHIRTVLPRLSILELAERPKNEWSIREHSHLVYALYPNATVLMQERHFDLIIMTPLAVDQTRIEVASVVPKPAPEGYSDKARRFWEANHAVTVATLNEDFEIAEQIQRGMHSGANEFFRFARFEGALTRWHRLRKARLGGCA